MNTTNWLAGEQNGDGSKESNKDSAKLFCLLGENNQIFFSELQVYQTVSHCKVIPYKMSWESYKQIFWFFKIIFHNLIIRIYNHNQQLIL